MNKILVAFHWHCGRMGDVNGLFVTTVDDLNSAIGKEVYFGEILGKHSEIVGTLEVDDFVTKSNDQEFISKLVEIIGSERISGYNPFGYFKEDQE